MEFRRLLKTVETLLAAQGLASLSDLQSVILQSSYAGESYPKIALQLGYNVDYVKQVGAELWQILSEATGKSVTKKNIRTILNSFHQGPSSLTASCQVFWGEAIDVSTFYGRSAELNTLSNWVLQERCRLVAILGMGGMGKSSLAVKFAQQQQESFEYVVWRSLLNAPTPEELLPTLIQQLSAQPALSITNNLETQCSELLELLKKQRCLLVLDNLESLFQQGVAVGKYLPGCEGYGYLFKKLAEVSHESCVILTSREKPQEVALSESDIAPVRSLFLSGIDLASGQAIFENQGFEFSDAANDDNLKSILDHYGGNPLSLKIVAAGIKELLGGNSGSFLSHLQSGQLQFIDINDILLQQLERLSPAERILIYWLMVNREPISIQTLMVDISQNTEFQLPSLLPTIQFLRRRSLVEQAGTNWYLQPVVMEFVTWYLIEQIVTEIIEIRPEILCHVALLKSHSYDFLRQAQIRLVLQPILLSLQKKLKTQPKTIQALTTLMGHFQKQSDVFPGYAPGNLINLLKVFQVECPPLDCSNLPIWQADLLDNPFKNINFSQATFQNCLFTLPFSAVLSVTFSPDGHFLAATNANGDVQLWRLQDGQYQQTLSGHQNWVRAATFSPNGQLLVSISDDATCRVWDTKTGTSLKTIKDQNGFPLSANFRGDGQRLATAHSDGYIRVWDVQDWELIKEFKAHEGWACRATYSPNGQQLVTGGADCLVKLWETEDYLCSREFSGHQAWIFPAQFSPDGQKILSAALDNTVRIWDAQNGDCLQVLTDHSGWVWSATFSPDGQSIASAGADRTIRLWDTHTGHCRQIIQGHTNQIWWVAYHPAGDRLVTGGEDQTIRLWDAQDGKCLQVIRGWLNWVLALAFHPNGKYLVSGHNDSYVRIWHLARPKNPYELAGHQQPVKAVACHPVLPVIASGSDDHTIKVWHLNSNNNLERVDTLSGHGDSVSSLDFSPDGSLLASASADGNIRLWNALHNECLDYLRGHQDKICAVKFSVCGRYLASASEDQTVRIWDINTKKCRYTYTEHDARVIAISFHPGGDYIASAGQNNSIKIWHHQTGETLRDIPHMGGWILSLSYSPCGQWLVSGGQDRRICIWDANTGELLHSITKHTNWVWDVAINPIDSSIASAGADELICIWQEKASTLLQSLRPPRPYEGMNIAGAQGLSFAQKENLKRLGAIEIPNSEGDNVLNINQRLSQQKC